MKAGRKLERLECVFNGKRLRDRHLKTNGRIGRTGIAGVLGQQGVSQQAGRRREKDCESELHDEFIQ